LTTVISICRNSAQHDNVFADAFKAIADWAGPDQTSVHGVGELDPVPFN